MDTDLELQENLDSTKRIEGLKFIHSLPKKKRIFIEEYILTDSPYKAAIKAGASPKAAYNLSYKLLQDEDVLKAINLMRYEIQLYYDIKKEYFISNLKAIVENKLTKVSEKISALHLLAKITGHIKERPPEARQLVILKQEGLSEKFIEVNSLNGISSIDKENGSF